MIFQFFGKGLYKKYNIVQKDFTESYTEFSKWSSTFSAGEHHLNWREERHWVGVRVQSTL